MGFRDFFLLLTLFCGVNTNHYALQLGEGVITSLLSSDSWVWEYQYFGVGFSFFL